MISIYDFIEFKYDSSSERSNTKCLNCRNYELQNAKLYIYEEEVHATECDKRGCCSINTLCNKNNFIFNTCISFFTHTFLLSFHFTKLCKVMQ